MQRGDTPLHVAAKLYLRLCIGLQHTSGLSQWGPLFNTLAPEGLSANPQAKLRSKSSRALLEKGISDAAASNNVDILKTQMYNCFSSLVRAHERAAMKVNQVNDQALSVLSS